MTLDTDVCKAVHQVVQPAVGVTSNAGSCGPRFETEAVFTSDLVTLTFDLSASKWGHGSLVSWASFLPIFILLRPSVLDLGSGTGLTDRQTDNGHQHLMPPSYGCIITVIILSFLEL